MKVILYSVITLAGIALLALAVWSQQSAQPSENDLSTADTGSSTNTENQEATSTNPCEVITLDCLSSQPEWSPTMSAPGIERIDPRELTLFDGEYELRETPRPLPGADGQPFILVNVWGEFAGEYCERFDIDKPGTCPPYGPEAYTEFAVLSADTREVIHAYKLERGYSFLGTKYSLLEQSIHLGSIAKDMTTGLGILYWKSFDDQQSNYDKKDPEQESYSYRFDFYTGELLSR